MRLINENDSGPYHVLHLPRGNGWRQALVLSTYSHIIVDVGPLSSYTHMIWLELTSGQVCGLTIPFSGRFLSYNDLEIIAKCFESTPLQNYEELPLWIGKLLGWYECEYTNIEKDIVLIAENAKKFDRLTDEDMRIAIKPIITQFREGILAFNKGLNQNILSSAGITCIDGIAGIKAYNYKVNLVKILLLNHHQTKKLSEEPTLYTMNSDHVLLPPGDGWRQVLVLPAVAWCADGVSLGSKVSRHMLWIELASGKVWGLTFSCFSRFLSMQELKFISQCFESAQKDSYESIPDHICKHLRWSECKYAHVDTDIELIAGDLERENILSNKVPHKEYQLTDTALQNAAKPIFLALTNRIQAFNLGLDQEALLQVGKKYIGEISDVIAYNYQFHPIEKISIYRRQAMQTFPLLREKFSHFTSDHRYVRLQQSIDSGNPLLPVLSDFFRCSKTVVRYLMGKDFSLIGNDWNGKVEHLADLLNILKPDFWPETEDDWYHFNLWMKPPFYSLGKPPQKDYSTLLLSGLNELAKVGYSRIPAWLERHKISMTDINTMLDFVRALKEWAEVVGGEPKQASQAFLKLSLLRQAQLNRSWHDWVVNSKVGKKSESGQVENKKDVEDLEWLTFIDEPWSRFQHIVVPLNHSLQLEEEGNKMQHCVGGYVGHCLSGNSHIFSIRNRLTGESLSTVELRLGDNYGVQGEISVGQHYGLKNSAPSDECQCTLTKFLSYLRKKRSNRLCELRRQRLEREERRAIEFQNIVWPQTRIDGFRKLLHGYTSLEVIGQKTSEVSAESRLNEKKLVECCPCPPQNQENNSTIMKIIEWLSLLKNSCLHSFNANLNHCE